MVERKPEDAESHDKQEKCPPLKQMYTYLTEGCNLACRHCWIAPKYDMNGTRYPVLPVELFEKAVMEGKKLGLSSVKLTGGEPLLHPDFAALLEILRREKLVLNIETNGMLCNTAVAKEISKSAQRFVAVSLDGADAETHDWVRGVKGSFDKACKAVRNLAMFDTPPQIIMTVMKKNQAQVEDVVRMAEELGASSVKFNVVQPTARGKKMHEEDLALDIRELVILGHKVETKLTPKTNIKLFFCHPLAFRSIKRIASGDGSRVCGIFNILGVIASGHYALCGIGNHVPEMVFGTVGKDSLEEIWKKNEYLRTIRKGLPWRLKGICSKCLMKGRCLGSCIAQNFYRTKSIWASYWFCEMADEAGLFPETRKIPV